MANDFSGNTIKSGSTSIAIEVSLQDVTTGNGLTGLVFNSAGLSAWYVRERSAPVQITLVTLAAITSAYASGGFLQVDAINAKGTYRLDVPNAAFASGVNWVKLIVRATGALDPAWQKTFFVEDNPITRAIESYLDYNLATGVDTAGRRSPRNALRRLANRSYITAGINHINKEDDASDALIANVTTLGGAIVEWDPV